MLAYSESEAHAVSSGATSSIQKHVHMLAYSEAHAVSSGATSLIKKHVHMLAYSKARAASSSAIMLFHQLAINNNMEVTFTLTHVKEAISTSMQAYLFVFNQVGYCSSIVHVSFQE